MKKTLIALTVAASAAVSGSAMAWTQGGVSGGVDIGGSLTPEAKVIPWEAQIGKPVQDLDGQIRQGSITADIPVNNTISILGIRTVTNSGFTGGEGMTPQISYGDTVDFNASENGVAPVTLDVKSADDISKTIGTLNTSLNVVARLSRIHPDGTGAEQFNVSAHESGLVFFGGVGHYYPNISGEAKAGEANNLFPSVEDKFIDFGGKDVGNWRTTITSQYNYSGYYASAIKAGDSVKLTLNNPAATDEIKWTAKLPITVSYM
ncbi:hypothetical protein ACOY7N_20955 [Enterobacter asburiae]|uniref:F4 family fimbrial subunit n=1 Tax=Enterobacter asburiae TaxID=61645 RepID=UPI003BB9D266